MVLFRVAGVESNMQCDECAVIQSFGVDDDRPQLVDTSCLILLQWQDVVGVLARFPVRPKDVLLSNLHRYR